MTNRNRRPAGLGVAALVVAATAMLAAGCSSDIDETSRDESGVITEGGELGVFNITVGDCLNTPDDGAETASVEAVTCTDPHDAETFFTFDLPDGDLPGQDDIENAVLDQCGDAFGDYVGQPYETSSLDMFYLSPSADTWDRIDDREVVCLIVSADGSPLEGSVKGSGR